MGDTSPVECARERVLVETRRRGRFLRLDHHGDTGPGRAHPGIRPAGVDPSRDSSRVEPPAVPRPRVETLAGRVLMWGHIGICGGSFGTAINAWPTVQDAMWGRDVSYALTRRLCLWGVAQSARCAASSCSDNVAGARGRSVTRKKKKK